MKIKITSQLLDVQFPLMSYYKDRLSFEWCDFMSWKTTYGVLQKANESTHTLHITSFNQFSVINFTTIKSPL